MLKYFLVVIFFFSPFSIFAQPFVDIFPDHIYIQEKIDWDGTGIIKINYDSSVERFILTASDLPKYLNLGNLLRGIRPKIRLDHFWISDGKKIYKKPLDAEPDQEWELLKLPDGIERFEDFEIISDKEAIICGCIFKLPDEAKLLLETSPNLQRSPIFLSMILKSMHFVFNYKTGIVTTTVESLDRNSIPYDWDDIRYLYVVMKTSRSYMCRFDSKIIIVSKHSGLVTVLDINPDNGKLRNSRKFVIIPEDEIPKDPQDAVNNGSAIHWIGPLYGDDVLICYRMWVVPNNDPLKPVIEDCFCTLNLRTGKVNFEGSNYLGQMAESHLTLYEKNGELVSVRDVINKSLKQIEQTKKPKTTPAPEQTEKQADQPPETELSIIDAESDYKN